MTNFNNIFNEIAEEDENSVNIFMIITNNKDYSEKKKETNFVSIIRLFGPNSYNTRNMKTNKRLSK